MKTPLHEVPTIDDLHEPGDYAFVPGAKRYPLIVCPACRLPMNCAAHEIVRESPLTVRPSILHGCRLPDGGEAPSKWHGYATDGVLEDC